VVDVESMWPEIITSTAVDEKNGRVVALSGGGRIIWSDFTTGKIVGSRPIEPPPDYAQLSPDGRKVIVIPSGGRTAQIQDVESGSTPAELTDRDGLTTSAAFNASSDAAIVNSNASVQIWDIKTRKKLQEIPNLLFGGSGSPPVEFG